MKALILKIGIFILNVIYFFIKLLPTKKNKVTFISRQTDNIPLDFKMLKDKLGKIYEEAQNQKLENETKIEKQNSKNIEIVVLCKTLKSGIFNAIKYSLYIYCIPICVLKQKKSLVVIQIWHALGSLKKFGYSSLDKNDGRSSKMAKAMKMHHNYTYILTSSETSKKFFMEAFNAKEEQMKVMNLPRVDFLKSKDEEKNVKEKFYEIYPEVNNKKKNILYCPTKRKDNNLPTKAIVKEIPFEKYNLIMKLHNGTEIIYVDGKKLQKDNFFTGMELLHVADYIVTDYSAIVYEAVITKKPIYFYTFDYNTYMNDRGTYINYKKEMPGAICKSFKNIRFTRSISTIYSSCF